MSCPHGNIVWPVNCSGQWRPCGYVGQLCASCAADHERAEARKAAARARGTSRGGSYRSKARKVSELKRAEAKLRAAETALRKVWKRCGALLEAADRDAEKGAREL